MHATIPRPAALIINTFRMMGVPHIDAAVRDRALALPLPSRAETQIPVTQANLTPSQRRTLVHLAARACHEGQADWASWYLKASIAMQSACSRR
ncbi:ribosome recycling factor [Sphingomonas sp. BK580]|nr:ribosome recycling factor [Sphingomonas sp. BK580]